MSFQCLDPYVAIKQFDFLDGSKRLQLLSKKRLDYDLETLKNKHGSDNVFVLPCGTCESCRRNKAEEWAIRCQLESQYHKFNYFVTLTFDDFHISQASEKDLQDFIDRLEGYKHKRSFKYFACQELGEHTERLHFHLVLFCDFEIDLFEPVKIGNFYHYSSKLMDDLWTFGFYTISPFQTTCARYVAKYTAKNSKLFMSRNIGKIYFLDHFDEIVADNFKVYADFGGKYCSFVPSCFIRWFDQIDPLIAKSHKDFKKSLSKLVFNEKMRSRIVEHEEDVIAADQARIIEKGSIHRVL